MSTPMRIVLIDDDEDDAFFFETALEELDHPVQFTYEQDAETALVRFQECDASVPDLLFLDWNMPKLTGSECLAAIKTIPRLSTVPIIIYTTSRSQTDRDIAKQLGASYFLSKPSRISELCKKLRDLLPKVKLLH